MTTFFSIYILIRKRKRHNFLIVFLLSLFLQPPEEGEEEKLGPDGETKIAMDQYYMDEYDQYAEGKRNSFDILTIFEYFLFNTC